MCSPTHHSLSKPGNAPAPTLPSISPLAGSEGYYQVPRKPGNKKQGIAPTPASKEIIDQTQQAPKGAKLLATLTPEGGSDLGQLMPLVGDQRIGYAFQQPVVGFDQLRHDRPNLPGDNFMGPLTPQAQAARQAAMLAPLPPTP